MNEILKWFHFIIFNWKRKSKYQQQSYNNRIEFNNLLAKRIKIIKKKCVYYSYQISGGHHWELSDSKSPQISSILLNICVNLSMSGSVQSQLFLEVLTHNLESSIFDPLPHYYLRLNPNVHIPDVSQHSGPIIFPIFFIFSHWSAGKSFVP